MGGKPLFRVSAETLINPIFCAMKRHLSNNLSLTNAALWNCVGDSASLRWLKALTASRTVHTSQFLSYHLLLIVLSCDKIYILSTVTLSAHLMPLHSRPDFFGKTSPKKKQTQMRWDKKKVSVKKPDGWTFDPLLQRCSRVERNTARHRWTATNGKSSLRSTCGDMFLQLEMARTGRDKHICCSVVLHQIAFISDWTENKMNRSRRGVTSSARISRAAEVSAGDF